MAYWKEYLEKKSIHDYIWEWFMIPNLKLRYCTIFKKWLEITTDRIMWNCVNFIFSLLQKMLYEGYSINKGKFFKKAK